MQPEGSVWRIDICYPVTEKRRNPLLNDPMSEKFMNPEMDPAVTSCGNCHAPMPKELRFCRNCGFRLGEGSAEYTETVRFQNPGTHSGQGPSAFPQGFGGMTVAPGGPGDSSAHFTSGNVKGTIYRYVVWDNQSSCPAPAAGVGLCCACTGTTAAGSIATPARPIAADAASATVRSVIRTPTRRRLSCRPWTSCRAAAPS